MIKSQNYEGKIVTYLVGERQLLDSILRNRIFIDGINDNPLKKILPESFNVNFFFNF